MTTTHLTERELLAAYKSCGGLAAPDTRMLKKAAAFIHHATLLRQPVTFTDGEGHFGEEWEFFNAIPLYAPLVGEPFDPDAPEEGTAP